MSPSDMWSEYALATGVDVPFAICAFCEGVPDLTTELGELVRTGPKRATAGLLDEYETDGEALPGVGDHSVVVDGAGNALCIIRTTSVDVRRFADVDERFAWDEGEGDRTLAWWRRAHIDYFTSLGFRIDDDTRMVLERFDVVWP